MTCLIILPMIEMIDWKQWYSYMVTEEKKLYLPELEQADHYLHKYPQETFQIGDQYLKLTWPDVHGLGGVCK